MYILGTFNDINKSTIDNITTIITKLVENENGLIFTASSYFEDISMITVGTTIPFRSWDYFCNKTSENFEKIAYEYLLKTEEFNSNSLIVNME